MYASNEWNLLLLFICLHTDYHHDKNKLCRWFDLKFKSNPRNKYAILGLLREKKKAFGISGLLIQFYDWHAIFLRIVIWYLMKHHRTPSKKVPLHRCNLDLIHTQEKLPCKQAERIITIRSIRYNAQTTIITEVKEPNQKTNRTHVSKRLETNLCWTKVEHLVLCV